MRVLIEYKGKRVDIKAPISARVKVEETEEGLAKLISEAVSVVSNTKKARKTSASFDEMAKEVAERLR